MSLPFLLHPALYIFCFCYSFSSSFTLQLQYARHNTWWNGFFRPFSCVLFLKNSHLYALYAYLVYECWQGVMRRVGSQSLLISTVIIPHCPSFLVGLKCVSLVVISSKKSIFNGKQPIIFALISSLQYGFLETLFIIVN